jgi:hypothetical protein
VGLGSSHGDANAPTFPPFTRRISPDQNLNHFGPFW